MEEWMAQFPRKGRVEWIGLRPERKVPLIPVMEAEAIENRGLAGDRKAETEGGKRQVTLIMSEGLDAAASFLDMDYIDPRLTRRNIVVKGLNLVTLKGKRIQIGSVELELTDECHPCSRMEANLGVGGYNALRSFGGWCAIITKGGLIAVGDEISVVNS
jgi:MOSC domain-containing protein YiiM